MLRSLMVFTVIMAVIPLILRMPHVGMMAWTWVSYMYPHRMVYGFAVTFPFLDFIAVTTALSWMLSREPKKIPFHPILIPFFMFVLWYCFTTAMALNHELAMPKFTDQLKTALFTLFMMGLINTRHRIDAMIYVICASLGYLGLKGGLFTILTGGGYSVIGPPGTFIEDRNQLAMLLTMIIPLLRYINIHGIHKYVRWGALVMMFFTAVAVLGTQSRGGFIALAVLGLWMVMTSRRRLPLLAVAVIIGGFTVSFMPQSWVDRMSTIQEYEKDGSAVGRLQMWRFAMDVAEDRPIGAGFKTFRNFELGAQYIPAGERLRASHSIYFEVLGEHGYPGLFLFLFFMASGFFTMRQIAKITKPYKELLWARDLSSMMQACLVTFAVGGALLEVAFAELFFHLVALSAILHLMAVREIARIEGPQEKALTGAGNPQRSDETLPAPAE